ncbi:DUF885 family protein [Pseudomonadales bacterium]|nr:DUF885 family protein [Pseudomonadales bacterium]
MHFKSYLALSFVLLSASIGHAEVTFDGSVGLVNAGDPVSSGNGYTYNITADLGEQAGANLFHSFAKFNIGSGELAHFSGPASIVNIVSRVTGGESSISGEITSSISGASLWLVNPAGFIFTNGAVVDVDGNFHLSSAEYLEFADGARFFSNLSAMSTLSTGDISSFGFLGTSTGAIKIDGTSTTIGEVDSLEHNLTDMQAMSIFRLENLAYHEGLPGHHLQIAIQQELEGLPRFRTYHGYTAFSEGWGLYSEWLGKEMGFYQDSYRDFGRLTGEIWRAIRLVVDTGIHAKGWTEAEAIDYALTNSPRPAPTVKSEIRRYFNMPGQATAYKVGMLEIQRIRGKAEAALKDRFDIRDFHDQILGSGPLPMPVLEQKIDEWIAASL